MNLLIAVLLLAIFFLISKIKTLKVQLKIYKLKLQQQRDIWEKLDEVDKTVNQIKDKVDQYGQEKN